MEKTNRLLEKIRLEALKQSELMLMYKNTDKAKFYTHMQIKNALERIIE